jgi:peptidoglycan/xylan/chitin deacetylase (PgdA/CDA1 family)
MLFMSLLLSWALVCHATAPMEVPVRAYDSCGTTMKLALTFDNGPTVTNNATATVLDILLKLNIVATFFVSPNITPGQPLDEKCSLVSRMVQEGHYVGCLSWNHTDLTSWTNEDIKNYAIDPCVEWVRNCSGTDFQTSHFRPPYGNLNYSQAQYVSQQLGMKIGFWSVNSQDYLSCGDYNTIWNNIQTNITSYTAVNGQNQSQVIDMQDVCEYNALNSEGVSVIEKIYTTYSAMGYQFVDVEDCYNRCDNRQSGICKSQQSTHYTLCSWNSGYTGCH